MPADDDEGECACRRRGRPAQAQGGVLADLQRPPHSGGGAGHHVRRAARLQVGQEEDCAASGVVQLVLVMGRFPKCYNFSLKPLLD